MHELTRKNHEEFIKRTGIEPKEYWDRFKSFQEMDSRENWFYYIINQELWNGFLGYSKDKITVTKKVEDYFTEEINKASKAIESYTSNW